MTLEYLNICQYNRAGGPLKYLQELEQFRADTSSLPVLVMADSLIRKKLYRLQSEQRESFSTFSEALLEAITNHKYLWNDARTKAALVPASSVPRSTLKEDGVGDHSRLQSAEKSSAPRSEKRKRQRERNKALLKEAKAAKSVKRTRQRSRPWPGTRGSLTASGNPSPRLPTRSRGPRGAITSIHQWVAQWETNAGSSTRAWSAGQLTRWWATTEQHQVRLPQFAEGRRMKSLRIRHGKSPDGPFGGLFSDQKVDNFSWKFLRDRLCSHRLSQRRVFLPCRQWRSRRMSSCVKRSISLIPRWFSTSNC